MTHDLMSAVYCYLFPEVRPVLREVEQAIPSELYKVTNDPEVVRDALRGIFEPELDLPLTADGHISLDEIHVPVIERTVEAYSAHAPGLDGFGFSYPTQGTSEGIFKILSKLKTDGVEEIRVLPGEYEGYGFYSKDLGMKISEIPADDALRQEPGHWFVSNPSAVDGNILSDDFITGLCDAGNKVVADLAYVGSTKPHKFDVTHENIPAVFLSLSKPYGLFRFRIGYTFTREAVPSLYGNKWFKDPARVLQGLNVVEKIGPSGLYEKYSSIQERIISGLQATIGLDDLQPSDVPLLAHMKGKSIRTDVESFRRGDGYRFCLTPYFERLER